MPSHHAAQPLPLLGNWEMAATLKFGFDLLQLSPHPRPHRLSLEQEAPAPRFPADVREPEEVEGLRLSQPPPASVPVRKATKFDEASLAFV